MTVYTEPTPAPSSVPAAPACDVVIDMWRAPAFYVRDAHTFEVLHAGEKIGGFLTVWGPAGTFRARYRSADDLVARYAAGEIIGHDGRR